MIRSTVFMNNRTQAVRLPAAMRFDESIKTVNVRQVGVDRVISPATAVWDTFFTHPHVVSEDFMESRDQGIQPERESF